jgi:hypothetical protein
MPHSVHYYASLEIAEVNYNGLVSAIDLRASTTDLVGMQRKHGVTRFLVNIGNHEVKVTPLELERLLDEQYWHEDVNRASRIAIIGPRQANAREAVAFFVQACRKRGWKAELLPDRRAAMDWLTTSERKQPA